MATVKGRNTPDESRRSTLSRRSHKTMTPEEAIKAGITKKNYEEEESEECSVSSDSDGDDVQFIEEDQLEKVKHLVQTEVKRLRILNSEELLDAPYAIKLIKKGLPDITPEQKKKVKGIVMTSHLRPSLKKPGLFQLTEAKPIEQLAEALTDHDRNLLVVFDEKLTNVKRNMKNIQCDFSGW